jgi:hypothetical protein
MRIKLTTPNAYKTALAILNGELPPEVNDSDVFRWVVELAIREGVDVSFYRDDTEHISLRQAEIAIERNIRLIPLSEEEKV